MDSTEAATHKTAMADPGDASFADRRHPTWRSVPDRNSVAVALGILAATTLGAHVLQGHVPPTSLPLLFVVAVLVVATRDGFWIGIAASVLAFLAYNFFFVLPLYSLRVAAASDVVTLLVLLAAGATTGFLTGRLREEANAAQARARTLELLAGFARDLAAASDADNIEAAMVRHLAALDGGRVVVLRAGPPGLVPALTVPETLRLEAQDLQAAERALRRDVDEAPAAAGWGGSAFTFRSLGRAQGVIGFAPGPARSRHPDHDEQVRRTIVDQGRLALDSLRLARDAKAAHDEAERETLRAALLASLSHDLNTPLATILGSLSSLRELGDAMPPAARSDLLLAAEEETLRLSRYVVDLLHLTRVKAGLGLRLDWVDAVDATHGAVTRARRGHAGRRIGFIAAADRPLTRADAVLLEQAVYNLVDNAAKFSAPDGDVEVRVAIEGGEVVIDVSDDGAGIDPSVRSQIFEPFFRGSSSGTIGTGLGLAIVRGIVRAMDGSVAVESPRATGRGTTMRIRLPLAREPAP